MPSRRDVTVMAAVGAAVAWIVTVTVLVAHEDDPGAPSAPELRDQLASALSGRDADALAGLLDVPGADPAELAGDYVRVLAGDRVRDLTVRLAPDERAPATAVVTGISGPGTRFTYQLAVTSAKGRWTVSFTPPLP
ncbi:hypothetical protein [Amycolatopsis jiangsuensis]|uniref:Uncharacterized protein n=1 Tax=Amycolatopsis jiangsuensis TaxID=1181879 RepID=A0A840IUZ1_9PSEU|nr:hypothetical protein [Amycolatopsis jiangsuensis]MBB4685593.1 hypothetical protein [Amycolatopsis jiangsuensis]